MAIGVSHGGANVYASDSRSDQVLVGTKNGVVLLERSGSGWHATHRALEGMHVSSIAPEPEGGTIFAGVFFGSIYASSDGGRTWEVRDEGLTHHDVYSLGVNKLADGRVRVYAGTEPANLFQSDDLGRHWRLMPLREVQTVKDWWFPAPPHVPHTKFIRFSPAEPNVIYVCIEQGALLRSEDLGNSWIEVNTLGSYNDKDRPSEVFYDIHKLLIDPRDAGKLFVTGGAGLYVSEDRGAHWERRMAPGWAKDVYPDGLVHNPRRPDVMFMSAAEHNPSRWRDGGIPGFSGSRMYRGQDGGGSWELLANGLPEHTQEEVGGLTLEDWGDGFQVFA
ncbi:MAG TPA: hypothetical protein VKU60_07110, partial [Chloroflexota bacterium]|nr:hypothetical protein [Chloroflexota bacterium]